MEIETNKMTKQPSYRFAGYTESWEEKKLGEVSEKVREKNSENLYSSVLTNSAEFGIIPQRDYFDKDIANEKNLNGYYIVKQNDFVYNPRISNYAPVGPIKPNKLNEVGIMSPLYYVFRTHDIENSYLATYFDTTYWHKFMKINGDSGARADRFAIKDSVFVEMPIPFPSLSEQTAIGSFFQDIDQLISLQQRKLEVLKEQKKTYLKLLFPAKGQTKPALRFVGFEDEWKEVKLGEVVSSERKGKAKSEMVGSKSIYLDTIYLNGGEQTKVDCDCDTSKEDIIILWDGSQAGTVYYGFEGALGSTLKSYKIFGSGSFYYQQMKASQSLIFERYRTPNIPHVIKSFLDDFYIFTTSLPEQEAIGAFFQDLDKAIAKQEEKVNQLKESKQTFLKKMFI